MLLLTASAVALALGIGVMPWRAWRPATDSSPTLVVLLVAGCTFLGIGLGGAAFGAVILLLR
jgi:hypothetical protein